MSWEETLKLNIGVLGFVISVILAGVKCVEFFNGRRDRSKDQRARVNDAWFKTIVLDGAIPAIRQFLDSQRSKFKQVNHYSANGVRPFAAALRDYLQQSEDLKDRLRPVEELSVHAYETVIRAVEALDDAVSLYSPHADDAAFDKAALAAEWIGVQRHFDACFRECLSVLRQLHFSLQHGRDPDKDISRPSLETALADPM